MKSSASMASGVKLLLFHQLARAAATVRPLEMSCSSWALSMGSIALEKGVEYQLYFAAANNFYPPSVDSSWVAANDCIDIAHGSAYYGDDTTLIFSGTVVLQET